MISALIANRNDWCFKGARMMSTPCYADADADADADAKY
jgi:hypothetical protein